MAFAPAVLTGQEASAPAASAAAVPARPAVLQATPDGIPLAALAQPFPPQPVLPPSFATGPENERALVQTGTPLEVMLPKATGMHTGNAVHGRLAAPVYVGDRLVLPKGTRVDGHIAALKGVPFQQRLNALMGFDFTPLHQANVVFDSLTLPDGERVPIHTVASQGQPLVLRMSASSKKMTRKQQLERRARGQITSVERALKSQVSNLRSEANLPSLEHTFIMGLPYHPQEIPRGAFFSAELKTGVSLPAGPALASPATSAMAMTTLPKGTLLHARLLTPLSSATAHWGTPVRARVSRPVVVNGQLIVPEGAILEGKVVHVKPAGHFARNGQLRFIFERCQLPTGRASAITADLKAARGVSGLKLDSEGGGSMKHPGPGMTALGIMLAASHDADGIYAPIDGHKLGVAGILTAVVINNPVLTQSMGYYSTARMVYSRFLGMGKQIIFPKDTELVIKLDGAPRAAFAPEPALAAAPPANGLTAKSAKQKPLSSDGLPVLERR